jgi:hypothetical protein
MSLVLQSSGGGSVTLNEPTTASNFTQDIPAVTGNVVIDSATQTLTNKTLTSPTITGAVVSTMNSSVITSGTAVTASGSSVDFTDIPSWVKRITVVVNGLSYAAAGQGVIRIGSGSLTTSGYTAIVTTFSSTPATTLTTITNGLASINTASAAAAITGQYVISNITGNTWVLSGTASRTSDAIVININGSIALGGTLDRLSLVATTSTFDAGTINILYE